MKNRVNTEAPKGTGPKLPVKSPRKCFLCGKRQKSIKDQTATVVPPEKEDENGNTRGSWGESQPKYGKDGKWLSSQGNVHAKGKRQKKDDGVQHCC